MGCRKLTYYLETEPKINTLSGELTTKISSERLRSFYLFGFNGKENDNEVKGSGCQQDYGMRIYDTRLGRFLSVDPLTKKYPELTPYQFASNTPIQAIDLDGMEMVPHYCQYMGNPERSLTTLKQITWDQLSEGAQQTAKGAMNVTCGLVSTYALFGFMIATEGVGAVWAIPALTVTLTQVGIGLGQMADGITAHVKDEKLKMPEGDNMYGLMAYGMNSKYAGLINAGTGFAADMVGAGPLFIKNSVSNFAEKPNFINSVTLFNDGKDVIDLATEIAKTAINEIHSEKKISNIRYGVFLKTENDGVKTTKTASITVTFTEGEGKDAVQHSYNKSYSETTDNSTDQKKSTTAK